MEEKPKRRSRGRQKIEMVKMKNETNLQVTFSKRSKGLFKKTHELCSLTGAKVVIIGFSPKDRPFSFGCPDVPSVLEKYQNPGLLSNTAPPDILVQLGHIANLQKCNEEIISLEDKLGEETRRGQVIDARIRQREKYWWESPLEKLTLEQAEKLKMDLLSLRTHVSKAIPNSQVPDLSDCYVPTMGFGIPQHASTALPSSTNGGVFADGGCSSTVAGSSSNQMADLYQMQKDSATGTSVLQCAGPPTTNTNVRPVEERSSIDLHCDPMASGSVNGPRLPNLLDYSYDLDDSQFLDLCFRNN